MKETNWREWNYVSSSYASRDENGKAHSIEIVFLEEDEEEWYEDEED